MAVTTEASGTKTVSVINTPETLDDVAAAGTYILTVNTINMAAGDVLELTIYKVVIAGGTRRPVYWSGYIVDAQPAKDLVKVSVPVSNALTDAGSLRFEINQVAGTARAFEWCVEKFA